jgi:hypothetical protein
VAANLQSLTAAISKSLSANTLPTVSLDQLKNEVDREITTRTFSGKITAKAAAAMRGEYNRIDQLEKASRAAATGLDAGNALTIRSDFAKLLKGIKAPAGSGPGPASNNISGLR